jgi:phage gp36-like protein
MKYTLDILQLALFFREVALDKDLQDLQRTISDSFSTLPVIMPPPPPEERELLGLPVVQFSDDDKNVHIARNRADLIFKCRTFNGESTVKIDKFKHETRNFVEKIKSHQAITRLGFIAKYFFETDSANQKISNAYQDKFISVLGKTVIEANIRLGVHDEYKGVDINNFATLRPGVLGSKQGVVIDRDFNTRKEDDNFSVITPAWSVGFVENGFAKMKLDEIITEIG